VRTSLAPRWSTDDISPAGRRTLAEHGIAPPGPRTTDPSATYPSTGPSTGPVPLTLGRPPARVGCPHCGAADTRELSHFGSTACKAIRTCPSCGETFDHVKAHG
jgi:ring-1,2-phenylacetyl-CoA epoxidase subunit PaaD